MRELLDIAFSSTISYSIVSSDELAKHGQELLAIRDLRDQLQYYNNHISSLCYSYPAEGLRSRGMYDHGHSDGAIFFQKQSSDSDTDFEVYLQERQKEIDRLKKLIEQQDTYYGKLKCFMEEKAGQTRFDELKIETNDWEKFIANGAGVVPENLHNHRPEIDLSPANPEETESFNRYLRAYVDQIFDGTGKQHWLKEESYRGFRALPAMAAIREQIKRAVNRDATIQAELRRIETQFQYPSLSNYIDFLYPYQIYDLGNWQSALFNAMMHGYQFKYSKKKLSIHEMKAQLHVEQVFQYYKYIHLLTTNVVCGSFQELFEYAAQNGAIGEINPKTYSVKEAIFQFAFSGWMQSRKHWEYGDLCGYQMYLTKKDFEDFLKEYSAEEQARIFLTSETIDRANQIYQQNHQSIRNWFRVKRKATKEDCKEMPRLKEGDVITHDPNFSTAAEAFALLTNYYAPQYMELEKLLFTEQYKTWNERTIQSEILEIESFIANADKLSLANACRAFNKWGQDTDAFIFLRLKSGFYENLDVASYPVIGAYGNKEASLYGRYFLFYDFLKAKLASLKQAPLNALDIDGANSVTADIGSINTNNAIDETIDQYLIITRNNFDNVPIMDVYNHFKKGLVDKGFLTESELRRYLKAAFDEKQVPSVRFKFTKNPKKKQVMKVFYEYLTEVAGRTHGRQMDYAALLGENFLSYKTSTVASNFSKAVY